jgi:hypothetical protein
MRKVLEGWNVLNCRACGMRKLFPSTIDLDIYDKEEIWKKLALYFNQRIVE